MSAPNPTPPASPWLVPWDRDFSISDFPTGIEDAPTRDELEDELEDLRKRIARRQRLLFADGRHALLLVFQAMDAAGKDGTIRAVLKGVNPAGCRVYSYKQPSSEELDHDFLWRTTVDLPKRGRIGVFNRSYYEEVLVVRVHPDLLQAQDLPAGGGDDPAFWEGRMESIRSHEAHLVRNGTTVVKFFLNVSRDEQKRRFLARLDRPDKHWKFSPSDVIERGHWDRYQHAYQEALRSTAKPWAPWYAIPADDKRFMRVEVARIILETLEAMPLRWPPVAEKNRARFGEMRARLMAEE